MKGRIDVLEELFRTRPLAASATMIWGETILHLCVKHNQLDALKFLLDNMDDPQFLNAEDDYGMTITQLAVAEVNAFNANGFMALDTLAQSKRDKKDWEIGELL
ncbi:hypothetical protein CUMW_218110 [Citrus unshiu]|uniref:Uncharacterized protein n=1 Tax=Citrus unshiu TaxID=55188 RepID=A0A2H5QCV7_CITUN|nr:hypothetical protein CUMW_218110 [Citrus unshiu]